MPSASGVNASRGRAGNSVATSTPPMEKQADQNPANAAATVAGSNTCFATVPRHRSTFVKNAKESSEPSPPRVALRRLFFGLIRAC